MRQIQFQYRRASSVGPASVLALVTTFIMIQYEILQIQEPTVTVCTTGIRSEKCVVRRFRRCANVAECTYTNLDGIAHYTPRLYGIAYCY